MLFYVSLSDSTRLTESVHNDMIWPPPFLRFVPHERISPVFHIAQYQQTFYKFLNFDKKVYLWINLHACQNWINISRSKISNDYTPSISLVLSLSPGHTSATIWPRRTSLPTASFILGKQGQAEYYYDYPGIYFRIRETWLSWMAAQPENRLKIQQQIHTTAYRSIKAKITVLENR